jgi:antitoxin (DNA-binding transcriptional repressor) of toxin-antitoxin stability system
MFVSVSDAKAQLTELVRRVEAGDEIILTRHGNALDETTAQTCSLALENAVDC